MEVVNWEAIPAPASGRATIVNVSTPEQINLIADLMRHANGHLSISIKAEPSYLFKGNRPVRCWHDWNSIRQTMAQQPNLEYELAFGERALSGGPQKIFQIISSCGKHLNSILWREEPELAVMLEVAIRYPYLSQAIRLDEADLSSQTGSLSSVMHKWRICGIKQLVIPAQLINSRVYKSFIESLAKIVNTGFELRLEGYQSSKDDFIRKIVAKRGGPPMDTDIVFTPEVEAAITMRQTYRNQPPPGH